ncbi:MAG: DNA repair protein RadA [Oligoflexia bacterium]|nr:DNA repair protein RadA [Oligoflexia bacterium]
MAKELLFECQICGKRYSKWEGRCYQCGEWNSISEIRENVKSRKSSKDLPALHKLNSINVSETPRTTTRSKELDRVLGGGIVKGASILIGGEPGIGKSTLLLELSNRIAGQGNEVLYVSGEESAEQIKLRADRLGFDNSNILIVSESSLSRVVSVISEYSPALCIVDSIQAVFDYELKSPMGSFSQLRQTVSSLIDLTKSRDIPLFLVGHVTKEGMIAGPKLIEHMVDAVIYFEGDENINYRMLRTIKNRFGPTNEIGIFEMKSTGLKDVENPSSFFLSGRNTGQAGSVIGNLLTGTRPILVEIQSLLSSTFLAMPRRTIVGYETNRVAMLLAVMEKRFHYSFGNLDLFVNLVGGLKTSEPSMDLAVATSIASGYLGKKLVSDYVLLGEIGLTGEVRKIPRMSERLNEICRLGFKSVVIPDQQIDFNGDIDIIKVKTIEEVFDVVFD